MGWSLELTCFRGLNVVSCEVVTGTYRTPIVGAYLLPSTLAHLSNLEEDLELFRGQDLIMLGDINVDLDESQNLRIQLVADLLTEFGLIDLIHQFCQRLCCRHLKTWTQVLQYTVLRAGCNYILSTDLYLFGLVGIRDMKKYSSDHFALRARLLQHPTLCHSRYLQVGRTFTLYLRTATNLYGSKSWVVI